MASSENPNFNLSSSPTEGDYSAVLAKIDQQLEAADENENQIERFLRRDKLLELRDELQTEIDREEQPNQHP